MNKTFNLLLLPGDGIGPEVVASVAEIIKFINNREGDIFQLEYDDLGGCSIDKHGQPITDSLIQKAKNSDAVLLGAVGGPKWEDLHISVRPEKGLLSIRKELELFANLRPAICFPELASASSLKEELISGLDILIVRELTGGIYFGQPRGIKEENGKKIGINTLYYEDYEIQRIARVAFDLASKRNGKVTSIDKANVLESTELWREEVQKIKEQEFQNIALEHIYVDNASMQLVRYPKQFDVIVTTNMFGDIISDTAAMLTGSLGMLPSASLGAADINGKRNALYEPVHGSAPDIAGQNIANPIATIMSFVMMLRYSFDLNNYAEAIENAVKSCLKQGYRTKDLVRDGEKFLSTTDITQIIIENIKL